MNNPTPLIWTESLRLFFSQEPIIAGMPTVGSQKTYRSLASTFTDPSLIDGRIVGLSNVVNTLRTTPYRYEYNDATVYLLNRNGIPANEIIASSTQAIASMISGPLPAGNGLDESWVVQRNADKTDVVTYRGVAWPSPLWWNGKYIILADN